MSKLEAEFQFEIGDTVVMKAAAETYGSNYAPRLVVIERKAQQCHGGVQKFLWVRALHKSSGMGRSSFFIAREPSNGIYEVCEFECIAAPPMTEEELDLPWGRLARAASADVKAAAKTSE